MQGGWTVGDKANSSGCDCDVSRSFVGRRRKRRRVCFDVETTF